MSIQSSACILRRPQQNTQQGFTLVEMVLSIIVSTILVLAIAGFVELGTKGYADAVDRQRVQTQAQFVLEKISREVRHAVPNSFSATGQCLSFYPIRYSGFYAVVGQDIQFLIGNDTRLTTIPAALNMIINPSRFAEFGVGSTGNVFTVGNLTKVGSVFTIAQGAQRLKSDSIAERHYIYDPNGRVEYCFSAGLLTRSQGGALYTVAEHIDHATSSFHFLEATLQRGGLVHIDLSIEQNGERSAYQQDIQVLNVP